MKNVTYAELQQCAGWNVRKLARTVGQIYDHAFSTLGLKNTQFSMLTAISGKGPLSINELAEFIGADRTTMSRNLNVLEKQSLIKIVKSKEDPRAREVKTTHRGELLLSSAYPHWQETQNNIVDILGEDEWETFFGLLTKLQQGATKMID